MVLVGLAFAPLLLTFFQNLWRQPEYQFFPQALAAAGFLAWDRLREVPRPMGPGSALVTAGLLFPALALLAVAVAAWSPWLGMLAALLAGLAVVWQIGGGGLLRKMAPAFVMVLTIIPPPLGLDVRFGLCAPSMGAL